MKWSPEEENVLREMATVGANVHDVIKVLRRSRDSVNSKAYSLGISLKGMTPEINMDAFNRFMDERAK